MMSIADNVNRIRERIAHAEALRGASSPGVTLVAASKTVGAPAIREAIDAGVGFFGENRVQELLAKKKQNAYDGAKLHFIGHLQKNKVKDITGVVSLIESVDSAELIRLIGKRACALGIKQDVLIEVNIAGESTKTGVEPGFLEKVLDAAESEPGVFVRGLMAIPPISSVSGANRLYFEAMYKLFVDIGGKKYDNVCMEILSMGMSGDYYDAILEGANLVRIGTAIFGHRAAGE